MDEIGDINSIDKTKYEEYLKLKVKLDNGEQGYVFSLSTEENAKGRWKCHVCNVPFNTNSLEDHVGGKNHVKRMALQFHPNECFNRVVGKNLSHQSDYGRVIAAPGVDIPELAPGEPVPPGFEDVVTRVPEIQSKLDKMESALIGLEYLCELTTIDEEPKYCCLLCDKRGDPRTVYAHLVCFTHRIKYLDRYFPKAAQALNNVPKLKENRRGTSEVLSKIVKAIHAKFGRLKPFITDADGFEEKRVAILKEIFEGRHFHESADANYESLVDLKFIQGCEKTPDLMIDMEKDEAKNIVLGKIRAIKAQIQTVNANKSSASAKRATSKTSLKHSLETKSDRTDRSRERSASTLSSLSSRSRSRSRSRSNRRRNSRSRSRSKGGSYGHMYRDYRREDVKYKHRSPPRRRYRKSRSRSRSRSNSPFPRRHRSPPNKYRMSVRSPMRSKPNFYAVKRDRSYDDEEDNSFRKYEKPKTTQNKIDELRVQRHQQAKYRDLINNLEKDMLKKLKYYEKNPEKHPLYPEEWKKFWNRRYKELMAEGKDASKHDFKPEWIIFWTDRMKELHNEDLRRKKEDYRIELGIIDPVAALDDDVVEVSPEPLQDEKKLVTVDDIKNTWKALTGSEIKGKVKSPSPKRKKIELDECENKGKPIRVITVLRLLAALENQLGSLGPRVNQLLSDALSLEKQSDGSSEKLLKSSEIAVLFETAKEKLKGQLFAGIVEKNVVNATRIAIQNIAELLSVRDKLIKELEAEKADPLVVPGIGVVDKVAIAQQIASALIQQGKTDVTEGDLEQLVNAVVGMAQANVSETVVPAPAPAPAPVVAPAPAPVPPPTHTVIPPVRTTPQPSTVPAPVKPVSNVQKPVTHDPISSILSTVKQKAAAVELGKTASSTTSSLTMLQSYNDAEQPVVVKQSKKITSEEMSELTEDDMKTLLQNFKDLSSEEQHCLITYLKELEVKDPARVEKLRTFVDFGDRKPSIEVVAVKKENLKITTGAESGRLSPFSLRQGGANPFVKEGTRGVGDKNLSKFEDDEDDDDYTFEDVYRAANKKVQNNKSIVQQMIEEQTKTKKLTPEKPLDSPVKTTESLLLDAKQTIDNLMGQLPNKYANSSARPVPQRNVAPAVQQQQQQTGESSNLIDDYNYQDDIFGYTQGPQQTNYNEPPQCYQTAPPVTMDYNYTNTSNDYNNFNNRQQPTWGDNSYQQQYLQQAPPPHGHMNMGYHSGHYQQQNVYNQHDPNQYHTSHYQQFY